MARSREEAVAQLVKLNNDLARFGFLATLPGETSCKPNDDTAELGKQILREIHNYGTLSDKRNKPGLSDKRDLLVALLGYTIGCMISAFRLAGLPDRDMEACYLIGLIAELDDSELWSFWY